MSAFHFEVEGVYERAWQLLRKSLSARTTWGRNQIENQMTICLEMALNEAHTKDLDGRG